MGKQQIKHPTKVDNITVAGGNEIIASTHPKNATIPFLDRPPQERKSEVVIVKCPVYGLAEDAVREAIGLLGGIDNFCQKGDVVIVKVNASAVWPVEIADTTHPAIVAAMVKILKEAGTTVKIMERAGFGETADRAYTVTGIKKAALEAGADELWDWQKDKYIDVDVPNPRSFAKVKLPKTLMEADAFIDLPKLKNNRIIGGLTLSIKSMLGLIPCEDRQLIHRMPVDMAAGCCDVLKAINHLHRLVLVDAVYAHEGLTHQGLVCTPGFITASADPVAIEAVCHSIVGYHHLESPAVQIGMKDGLGTGDLSEIDILGTKIQDVYYPFVRSNWRYVQRHLNVTEYFGGTCNACVMGMQGVPPVVEPDKKYAVIGGTRALVAKPLTEVDEVYLVGECACRADHQFKDYMDKVKAAKKVIKLGTCPGHSSLAERKWGGIYDRFHLLATDGAICSALPDLVRPNILKKAYGRRSGQITKI